MFEVSNLFEDPPDNEAIIGTENWNTAKEQSEAFRRAWISNTEIKLLDRKTKSISKGSLS